jgi:hypothetical protein
LLKAHAALGLIAVAVTDAKIALTVIVFPASRAFGCKVLQCCVEWLYWALATETAGSIRLAPCLEPSLSKDPTSLWGVLDDFPA